MISNYSNQITAQALTECGISVDPGYFTFLDEATKINVADEVLSGMFKFITDKYNSMDFAEIERSAGDYLKFKFRDVIASNTDTLRNIYSKTSEPGAAKYLQVLNDIQVVHDYLAQPDTREKFGFLYKKGVGLIQVLYCTMVVSMIYALTALVSNTIRFVTSEQGTDMEVLFDEVPNTIKHVHIRNLRNLVADISTVDQLATSMYREAKAARSVNESVSTAAMVTLVVAGIIYLIPKVIVLIREIIYSIYYARVKISEALNLQVMLIRTNIESLELGRGDAKIIARQKKIADNLEKLSNAIAVKSDKADSMSRIQISKENQSMHVDKQSEYASSDDRNKNELLI